MSPAETELEILFQPYRWRLWPFRLHYARSGLLKVPEPFQEIFDQHGLARVLWFELRSPHEMLISTQLRDGFPRQPLPLWVGGRAPHFTPPQQFAPTADRIMMATIRFRRAVHLPLPQPLLIALYS
jgi:hypothetical protein